MHSKVIQLCIYIYLFFLDSFLISGSASPPTLFFVFKVILAVPGPLLANFYKIEIVFICVGIVLNLLISFGRIDTLILLRFLIDEHVFFCSYKLYLIFWSSVCSFQCIYSSYIFLMKFIPKYLFYTIIKVDVFNLICSFQVTSIMKFYFFIFIVIKHTSYRVYHLYHFQVYSSLVLSIFILLCNQSQGLFHVPKLKLHTI